VTIETYDALVLGCGESGKYIAWHLAKSGQRVAVIEDRYIGGSCPNIACLPSKNLIASASVARIVRESAAFGIQVGEVSVSMEAVQARKRAMVDGLIALHRERFTVSGAELVMGRGRFTAERTIEVTLANGEPRVMRGERVFLDVGAFASLPDLPGLRHAVPMTHVELLDLEGVPDHLLILGGGYIALELAQAMRRFGGKVTICERSPRLLPHEDDDIAIEVSALLRDEGITILTDVAIASISGLSGDHVTLEATIGGVKRAIEGTHLLVATGKTPNTRDIGLDRAGIEMTDHGYVRVNDRLETTAQNVWALGDCAGSPAFTHMSFEDFRIVRDNLAGGDRRTTGRQVPSCLFLEPELARIGLTETEARAQGLAFRTATLPVRGILRSRTTGETRGLLKLLVAPDDTIVGFAAFAPHAGEFLPVVQLAMAQGLAYHAIEALVIAHPTWSEALVTLCGAVPRGTTLVS